MITHIKENKCKTAQWIILVASLEAIIAMWDTEMHNLFSNCLQDDVSFVGFTKILVNPKDAEWNLTYYLFFLHLKK